MNRQEPITPDFVFRQFLTMTEAEKRILLGYVIDHFSRHPADPSASNAQMQAIAEQFAAAIEPVIDEAIADELADFKIKRNRKSDPATVKRNVEICDLRKENPKFWSQGRLGKKYSLTPQAIRSILKDESKWRDLASTD